jgi:hypothetical protein
MKRTVFVIPPNGYMCDQEGVKLLTPEIEQSFGHAEKTAYIIGEMIERPMTVLSLIEKLLITPDTEVFLVLIRDEDMVYAPPEMIHTLREALRNNTDNAATTWDVLDKVIPYNDADQDN